MTDLNESTRSVGFGGMTRPLMAARQLTGRTSPTQYDAHRVPNVGTYRGLVGWCGARPVMDGRSKIRTTKKKVEFGGRTNIFGKAVSTRGPPCHMRHACTSTLQEEVHRTSRRSNEKPPVRNGRGWETSNPRIDSESHHACSTRPQVGFAPRTNDEPPHFLRTTHDGFSPSVARPPPSRVDGA